MRGQVVVGPLTAWLRECWVDAANPRLSGDWPDWTTRPTFHALVVESVQVEPSQRRQGHLRRFLEELCADQRFARVVVEGVQNPILAEALLRWGWQVDPAVMDFYKERLIDGQL